jgi:hypothetical protein
VDQTLESWGSLVIGITTAVYKQEHSHAGSNIEDRHIDSNLYTYTVPSQQVSILRKGSCCGGLVPLQSPVYNKNLNYPEYNLGQNNSFTGDIRTTEKETWLEFPISTVFRIGVRCTFVQTT